MTRELVEAAKAVLEAAYYNVPHDVSTDQGAKRYAAFQRLYAAVRAAEAAPVADAERVLEAAKAAVIAIPGFKNISALSQWVVCLVADAIRPYITPAPVADAVAVPVATLNLWVNRIKPLPYRDDLQRTINEITALLPPPPAPEPSAELVETWEREALALADKRKHASGVALAAFLDGVVAARRAEWAKSKKGGG